MPAGFSTSDNFLSVHGFDLFFFVCTPVCLHALVYGSMTSQSRVIPRNNSTFIISASTAYNNNNLMQAFEKISDTSIFQEHSCLLGAMVGGM